ncbi:hypothetical protein V0288_07535 [Pannus brasiliensis CCIBt3594]|uniref:Uncharacterized protein n=1 Tax=Pannus brasiliensis CCIBt3594 TaxID=1427578 RepID=A0AAW9QPB5_9CHRO
MAYSNIRSGVRCAETIATSWEIWKSSRTAIASFIVGRSESLPIITPTRGESFIFIIGPLRKIQNLSRRVGGRSQESGGRRQEAGGRRQEAIIL